MVSRIVPGKIVEVLPWVPGWRPGDRYGTVVGWNSRGVVVRMRQSGALVVYRRGEVELHQQKW